MGISRSASTVIAYLMRKFNYGFSFAYNFVKKKRPIICPNYGFCRQLKDFEKTVKKVKFKMLIYTRGRRFVSLIRINEYSPWKNAVEILLNNTEI
jgi:undecaprenyl pyrophosphate phosphatase UppP